MALRLSQEQYDDLQRKSGRTPVAVTPAEPAAKKPRMNKTETRYETERLKPALHDGQILAYHFEGLNFRLAERTHYRPDFAVVNSQGLLELHEIKGGWIEEDAMIKFKVAAEMYPHFRWKMWQYKGGVWTLIRDF